MYMYIYIILFCYMIYTHVPFWNKADLKGLLMNR